MNACGPAATNPKCAATLADRTRHIPRSAIRVRSGMHAEWEAFWGAVTTKTTITSFDYRTRWRTEQPALSWTTNKGRESGKNRLLSELIRDSGFVPFSEHDHAIPPCSVAGRASMRGKRR